MEKVLEGNLFSLIVSGISSVPAADATHTSAELPKPIRYGLTPANLIMGESPGVREEPTVNTVTSIGDGCCGFESLDFVTFQFLSDRAKKRVRLTSACSAEVIEIDRPKISMFSMGVFQKESSPSITPDEWKRDQDMIFDFQEALVGTRR